MKRYLYKFAVILCLVIAVIVYINFAKGIMSQYSSLMGNNFSYGTYLKSLFNGSWMEMGNLVTSEKITIGDVYDDATITTTDGDLIKITGITTNENNYDYNYQYIRDTLVGKEYYIVEDMRDDDCRYCFLFSSKPKSFNVDESLNAFLIRKGVCVYSPNTRSLKENGLQYLTPFSVQE